DRLPWTIPEVADRRAARVDHPELEMAAVAVLRMVECHQVVALGQTADFGVFAVLVEEYWRLAISEYVDGGPLPVRQAHHLQGSAQREAGAVSGGQVWRGGSGLATVERLRYPAAVLAAALVVEPRSEERRVGDARGSRCSRSVL